MARIAQGSPTPHKGPMSTQGESGTALEPDNWPDNWFVAQLKPNGAALALRNLARQGFETFLPARMESAGTARPRRRALFPGYLFVRFDPAASGWGAINATRGITRLILSDPRQPHPLPGAFMAGLIARCDASGLVTAPETVAEGDRVRIIAGPFADLVTTVETLEEGRRLQVLLDLMGQQVRTSLPASAVTPL